MEEVASIIDLVDSDDAVTYVCYGFEVGDSGTPHLQGYMELDRTYRISKCKKLIPRAHFEPRKGTQDQAILYCEKDGDFHEYGVRRASNQTPVTRANLIQDRLVKVAQMIKDNKSYDEVFAEDPYIAVHYMKWVEKMMFLQRPEVTREVTVFLLHGEPGTGKTRLCYDEYPDLYSVPCNTANSAVWFNGYQGQSTVLLDDFSGEMPLVQLLRLLDRYSVQVPYKGGYLWFAPGIIIITSNVHPKKWYNYWERDSSFQALKRRFSVVLDFNVCDQNYEGASGEYKIGKLISKKNDSVLYETWWKNLPTIHEVMMYRPADRPVIHNAPPLLTRDDVY